MASEKDDAIDFGELVNDEHFKSVVTNFDKSVNSITNTLNALCDSDIYNQLNVENKVKYDLFLTFSLSSLFWLYLRTQGHDPNEHGIKREIERVKSYMADAKKVEERKSMPKINQGAAQRFVRNALWNPKENETTTESSKKRKRTND